MTPPAQPDPHRAGFLWAEEGEVREGLVAEVVVRMPPGMTLSYVVPAELADRVLPGQRVRVRVGKKDREEIGFVTAVSRREWTTAIKPVEGALDEAPLLDEPLLALGLWIAEYYVSPPYRALAAMVPAPVRSQVGFRKVRLVSAGSVPGHAKLSAKQRAVLDALADAEVPVEWHALAERAGCTEAVLRTMHQRGLLDIETELRPAEPPRTADPQVEPTFTLNADQQRAVEQVVGQLERQAFRVNLLHGVSGSGKTEVYVRAVRRAIEMRRQGIILVPEIALTAQTHLRLVKRFERVAVIHSGMTGKERSLAWSASARGEVDVVIGTRSAVFAPCRRLGIIVVDEEQEPSYKNPQAPRYHARDVAIKRAQLASCPVVLGSATPSLETWLNAQRFEHYRRLALPRRVGGLPLPTVHLVDMREEHRVRRGFHLLGRLMEKKLGEALARGEQAVLLLNRRGYASYLFCPSCKERMVCPRCSVNLVLHRPQDKARCHYCDAWVDVPAKCPNSACGHKLVLFGMGTQRVEEELARKFPSAKVARADSDTMTHARDYPVLIRRFESREVNVLLGTQMIAKGLDFPFVSFVGVVSADTALAIPDFRSAERTFQLVTQVAGRAGRAGTGGEVVVQSFSHDIAAIQAAVHQHFERFAEHELPIRKQLQLPPYWRMTRMVISDASDSKACVAAQSLAERIKEDIARLFPIDDADARPVCVGPQKCAIERLKNQYRYDVSIRTPAHAEMKSLLDALHAGKALDVRADRLVIDVDPVSLM